MICFFSGGLWPWSMISGVCVDPMCLPSKRSREIQPRRLAFHFKPPNLGKLRTVYRKCVVVRKELGKGDCVSQKTIAQFSQALRRWLLWWVWRLSLAQLLKLLPGDWWQLGWDERKRTRCLINLEIWFVTSFVWDIFGEIGLVLWAISEIWQLKLWHYRNLCGSSHVSTQT